ncbi:SHOCT domain-containing protein [Natronosalvus rutilus]|uniref:SHOCT domain-containing protein n=1 Tax=Natronosalvus rutilus TaxID=2953753 RepID=A0A9E7N827_9EURY|nr:SHOCT domain-containing protein [Natronosalvus rutilus]UTF52053.1 SHOCT domain-containing protein [Natronosalvus rutilus]
MTPRIETVGRTGRQTAMLAIPLFVGATESVAAHGGESTWGGMMGDGWGLFGGAMGLWGLLWMGALIAIPLFLVYSMVDRGTNGSDDRSLSVLRERYARGDLSDDEFERRRERLERDG